jgi:hypothetical protein
MTQGEVTTSRDGQEANNDNHKDNVMVIIAACRRWREAKRGKYAAQMMETTMMEMTMMEKMTTKKTIPNLLSAHPRAEKAPKPILHASWLIRLRYWCHGAHVVKELKRA